MQLSICRTQIRSIAPLLWLTLVIIAAVPALAEDPPANFPPPTEWDQPASAPPAPGDAYTVNFGTATPAPTAPVISEWTRTAKADESFTLTGIRFTARTGAQAGTDTTVWLYAWNGSTGTLRQCRIWKIYGDYLVMAAVPADLPYGMYLVWVENENGVSSPICLNKTQADWIGPLGPYAVAGDTKRVFGKNISNQRGTTTSNVYIQPATGGAFTQCQIGTIEPGVAEFTVPAGTPVGSYNIFVHNGHGGRYGWSKGQTLTVKVPWVRGSNVINVSPSGGNDVTAIQTAIDTVTTYTNGGTVQLSSGTFSCTGTITLKNNVCLIGAGPGSTTLSFAGGFALPSAPAGHITIQDFTVRPPANGHASGPGGFYLFSDITFRNIHWLVNSNDTSSVDIGYFPMDRFEVDNSILEGNIHGDGRDWWIHNCELHGARPWPEAAISFTMANGAPHGRYVIENNNAQTVNWPAGPTGNYYYWDWLTTDDFNKLLWCPRLINLACQSDSLEGGYISHNTTNNTAIIDNRGEIILLHPTEANHYCQVESNSGRTLTIRTDGSIDGDATFKVTNGGSIQVSPMTSVPTDMIYGGYGIDNEAYVIIAYGTGIGQYKKIVSHTATTLTVDSDWRVPPAADSRIMLDLIYVNYNIYQNTLHALPLGYEPKSQTASNEVILASCFAAVTEENVSYRTQGGVGLCGAVLAPTWWTESRNDQCLTSYGGGHSITGGTGYPWYANYGPMVGPLVIGGFFRGGISDGGIAAADVSDVKTSNLRNTIGNAFEGVTVTHGTLSQSTVGLSSGNVDDTLFRNNTITVAPDGICANLQANSQLMLCHNSYTGGSILYNGIASPNSKPTGLYRVARFNGYVGRSVDQVIVPVMNLGIASMNWTATPSDPWITCSIPSGPTSVAEDDLGRLVVSVDTSSLPAGVTWGSITIDTGTSSDTIGVRVELSSGTPPNNPPTAAFSTNKSAGTAPTTIAFSAGSSSDTDGAIAGYSWDFGDGTFGSGVTTSHTYAVKGIYTPVLTVTDSGGAKDTAYSSISVTAPLTSVTIAGSPTPPVNVSTPVTLTATGTGGYQTQYKFVAKSGNNGWTVLRDYQTSNTFVWTPNVAGYYEVKAYAKALDSLNAYDVVSNTIAYPVGILPLSGVSFWLKADAGVTKDSSNLVSDWADQTAGSNKRVSQSNNNYKPTFQDNSLNGRPTIHFAGNTQALSTTGPVISGTGAFTAFAMARCTAISQPNYQYIWWDGGVSTADGYGVYIKPTNSLYTGWGGSSMRLALTVVAGTWYSICSRYTPGTHEGWLNGTYINSGSTSISSLGNGFAVGNYASTGTQQGLVGDVAEILIYGRNLSETERQQVETYLQARWTALIPIAKDRLADVKALPDGVLVSITAPKVATVASGTFADGSIYVEDLDRTSAMKVTGATASLWDNVTLTGTTGTDARGEKVFTVSSVDSRASGTNIGTLGMRNSAITSSGLLVRVWGKVLDKSSTYFTLDDGSGAPIKIDITKVSAPITSNVQTSTYVAVTGLAGMGSTGVVVAPRGDGDISLVSN